MASWNLDEFFSHPDQQLRGFELFADSFDLGGTGIESVLAQQNAASFFAASSTAYCKPQLLPQHFAQQQQQQQQQQAKPFVQQQQQQWPQQQCSSAMPTPLSMSYMQMPVMPIFAPTAQSCAAASAQHYMSSLSNSSSSDNNGSGCESDRPRHDSSSSTASNCSSSSHGHCTDEEDCSSTSSQHESSSEGKKRKRDPDSQTFVRARNREYSRNWRSKRKEDQEKLQQELSDLRAFRTLMEGSIDMISVHSSSCSSSEPTFTYASPAFTRVLDIEPQHLIGSSLLALVHPEDAPLVQSAFAQLAAGAAAAPKAVVYRFKHPITGAYRLVESTLRTNEQGVMLLTRVQQQV